MPMRMIFQMQQLKEKKKRKKAFVQAVVCLQLKVVRPVRFGLLIMSYHLVSCSYSVKSSEVRICVRLRIRSQVILCYFSRVISDSCRR